MNDDFIVCAINQKQEKRLGSKRKYARLNLCNMSSRVFPNALVSLEKNVRGKKH